jgi:excisionase family DNA binding protein
MENVQMLVPMEPKAFWQQLRTIVEQVVAESKQLVQPDKHTERPLLKAKEVCEIFQISKPTIYEWLKQGKIKSVKIQSRRYFHWKDVEELIQKSKVDNLKAPL